MGDPLSGDMDTTGAGRAVERGINVQQQAVQSVHSPVTVIVIVCATVSILGSVLDIATMVMEKVAPTCTISPVMVAVVAVGPALSESLCPPSCW